MAELSESLRLLIDCIGEADAVRLIEKLGGTRWHVPKRIGPEHPWTLAIGPEPAARLAALVAGETGFRIPRDQGVIDGLIHAAWRRGMSQNDLAVLHRRDVRSIQNAIARHRRRAAERERQADLFG